jgi:hypothetical protein
VSDARSLGDRDAERLRGNGVELVRERELARKVQAALARLYSLDATEDVRDFIELAAEGERETLLVRESEDGLELSLRLAPIASVRPAPERTSASTERHLSLDGVCQLIEGVSHFVYIAERAEAGRSTTQLELEIQAEVDKYVVLAAATRDLDVEASEKLRGRLYDRVAFTHEAESEPGARYRVANAVAKRFTRRLERDYLARWRIGEMHQALRAFFRMGQSDKLRVA